MAKAPKEMEFQTEVKQLLDIVIHSLYTEKEIFLRELVSNASDALDKIRFESLTNPEILNKDKELSIHIKPEKKAKKITISDNGIGMTKQEVIDNIGTIARSGSRAFLDKLSGDQKEDSNLIGRFGVGFYSVFMVASRVTVITKRAGSDEPGVIWESKGENGFSINEIDKKEHGTDVIVYLKEEEPEYIEEWKIKSIIKKYSDFIAFPIYLPNEKGKDELVNITKPLWMRNPSEIKDDQYEEFYKHSLGAFDSPLCTIHNKAEGIMEYSSMLFIPKSISPFEMYNYDRKHGVKLYVKRVFIMDDCKELLPEYLRFVKGVVDSEDLPLNISRETLQSNALIAKIRKALVGRILGRLKKMAQKEPDKYKEFWKSFGAILKEGLHSDLANKDKLLELLRFSTTKSSSEDDFFSLEDYKKRMKKDQKEIYYITGENQSVVEKSPHLEIFREKDIEVIYFTDSIDEFIIPNISEYDGKKLKSIVKGDLDLGDLDKEEKEEKKESETKYKKLIERVKNILNDDVKDVRVTRRLKESPSCLVTDENDMGAQMEKMMKAMGQAVPGSKPILEINTDHMIIQNLQELYNKDPKSQKLDEWVKVIFDQAMIAQGQMVKDPLNYTKRVNELLLSVSSRTAGKDG